MNVETEDNSKDIFYVEPQFCIFVLGAGFTRAFAARAPLLVDDYDTDGLFESFKNFPFASQVMELESRLQGNGKINIERLLTRLQDGMPYDAHHGAEEELQLLLSYIKRQFSSRIERIRETGDYDRELIGRFAEFCVNQRCSCISFNYDDLLDEALWAVKSARGNDTSYPYWHPDGGYGFFCKPSETIVEHLPTYCDDAETLLLKLHGSINWRLRLGAGNASGIDSIVHHETWLPPAGGSPYELIERHLEREPTPIFCLMKHSQVMGVQRTLLSLITSKTSKADKN